MEYFKKVYIKSEGDLPEKNGIYFIKFKTHGNQLELSAVSYIWANDKKNVNSFWLTKVDWYLLPIEPIRCDAEEIINGLGNIITGIQSDIDFNEKINIGLLIDGLTVILDQTEDYVIKSKIDRKSLKEPKVNCDYCNKPTDSPVIICQSCYNRLLLSEII